MTEIYAAIDRSNGGQTLPESIVNTARRAIDKLGKTTLGQALVLTGVGLAGAKVGESLNRPKLSRTPSEGLSPASNASESSASQAPPVMSQTANTSPRNIWSRRGTRKNWKFYPSKV